MYRYHFNIGGAPGQLGLAGAIMAEDDADALTTLQGLLDDIEADAAGEGSNVTFCEDAQGNEDFSEAGVTYVNVLTNGLRASMDMFDEIMDEEGDEVDRDEPDPVGAPA